MKKDLHPEYHEESVIVCACGATFKAGSTKEKQTTDICSHCHPFFTGKANIVDTAGRVDAFKKKMATANSNYSAEKKAKTAAKKEAKKTKGVKVTDTTK